MRHAASTAKARQFEIGIEPDFDFLADEYRLVYEASGASAFQAPLWLSMMHEQLAPKLKARQHTMTVRTAADGRLVALFPFVEQVSAGVRVVQPADFGLCDRNDVVAARDVLESLAGDKSALADLQRLLRGADMLLFRKMWADGFDIGRLFPRSRARRAGNDAYVCETGTDFERWKKESLRKKTTKELGRLQRQTERDFGGYEHRQLADPAEIRAAFAFLKAARHDRNMTSLLDDPRYFDFYLNYALEGAASGEAITYASYIGGEPAAVLFGLAGDGVYHAVLIGADIGRHARQSTGIQLLYRVMEMRMAQGHSIFDMGLGGQGYKSDFRPREVAVSNVTRSYSPSGAAIALIYHSSKPLKDFLKGILPNVR